jgi:hypothetical protein
VATEFGEFTLLAYEDHVHRDHLARCAARRRCHHRWYACIPSTLSDLWRGGPRPHLALRAMERIADVDGVIVLRDHARRASW